MRKEIVTLPPGHYIIADPDYFKEYLPYLFFGLIAMVPSLIISKIVTMLILPR